MKVIVDNLSDELLLNSVNKNDSSAFSILYERYWELAYGNAYKRVKDADVSKDIVQEIFIHIWQNRQTLQIRSLPAYLHIAVRNKVFKYMEKSQLTDPFSDYLQNCPTHLHADKNIRLKEFYCAYEALLNTLPPKRQIIFRLRFHDELSTKAIANQLNLSRKTVQNQLGKAIDQLRVSLMQMFIFLLLVLG